MKQMVQKNCSHDLVEFIKDIQFSLFYLVQKVSKCENVYMIYIF